MTCAGTQTGPYPGNFGDAYYHLIGALAPLEKEYLACDAAVAQVRAMGLDSTDPANNDYLQAAYEAALSDVNDQSTQTPVANPIQKAADQVFGTATPTTPIVSDRPPKPGTNYGFLIAAFAVVAFGFLFVFR